MIEARNNKELRRYTYILGVDLLPYSNFTVLLLKSYTQWKQAYNKKHLFLWVKINLTGFLTAVYDVF